MNRSFLRNGVFLLLALVLAGTSAVTAVARGQMPAAFHAVLCTEAGLSRVALDARGNPVEPVAHCPDCTLVAVAILPSGSGIAKPLERVTRVAFAPVSVPKPGDLLETRARAPPILS